MESTLWKIGNGVPHLSNLEGSLCWKFIYKLIEFSRGIAKCSLGNGVSYSFWEDV
jgi:hypothetical protein